MKTLYLDCSMGAAGDMLTAALLELCPDKNSFLEKVNGILDGKAVVSASADQKCGITGTHVSVLISGSQEGDQMHENNPSGHHHKHHHHTSASEINELIDGFNLEPAVKNDVKSVYKIIAQAESQVHGQDIQNIHFHEVGSLDALADVLCVCMLINQLAPEKIYASPVHVGSGTVKCAHGVLPVPAPATELILRGIPIYTDNIRAELCTPTGAALLKHFVHDFIPVPVMRIQKCGYGTGKKEFEVANIVRAMLGEVDNRKHSVLELCCNIDDMTPESLSFAMERLYALGALDVYFTNIGMKKSRPAVMLTCMCRNQDRDAVLAGMFKHTTTLGVREYVCNRYNLNYEIKEIETPYGGVRIKNSCGWGVSHTKYEYEDIARIAVDNGLSMEEITRALGSFMK